MGWNTRGHPYGLIAAAQAAKVVSAVPCGVVSVCLIANGTDLSTVTVYDHATAASGTVVCKMTTKNGSVYCPSKPDACSNGCVVKTEGTGGGCTISTE